MFTAESEASLLEGNPDFVIDCIDDIDTKASYLQEFWFERELYMDSIHSKEFKSAPTWSRFFC